MEVIIVTGTSRGLGAALVEQLLDPTRRVIAISRQGNDALAALARERGAWLDWYLQDLADVDATDNLAQALCAELPRDAQRYLLINNAGALGPVANARALVGADVARTFNLNVTAALAFTARFLDAVADLAVDKRVVNISSGAARNPIEGWSTYCASKAALDMFTRAVKLEQARLPHPVRLVSLAPGVIDTAMQGQVRNADPASFPRVAEFRDMKEHAKLASAGDAARRILQFAARADFGEKEIADIRDY